MIPVCAGCGGPTLDSLSVQYRYPREEFLPEAVDPWYVHGSAPIRSCGSPACGAAGLLAALDEVITNAAFVYGRLLDREDLDVLQVGRPGDFIFHVLDDPDESS